MLELTFYQQACLMTSMKIHQHLLVAARQVPSPNFDFRPDETDISLIVIHGISLPPGQFGGTYVEQFFTNVLDPKIHPYFESIQNLRVSSHLFIRRSGEVIQFVPFNKKAFHAGESTYCGRNQCNDYSIGIELEGTDEVPYETIQYEKLCSITLVLMKHYPAISTSRIVGHSDIAPKRKTDPGLAFDWTRYRKAIS